MTVIWWLRHVMEDIADQSPRRRTQRRWFNVGYSHGYRYGYAMGVRDERHLSAVERADEASGARQPYPNE